ncbi:hypothetical protein ZWY2020_055735 [Hordeum vulgare]|nr:hypothetical protein ZWY2020_055735 [Hordeum vulgare]
MRVMARLPLAHHSGKRQTRLSHWGQRAGGAHEVGGGPSNPTTEGAHEAVGREATSGRLAAPSAASSRRSGWREQIDTFHFRLPEADKAASPAAASEGCRPPEQARIRAGRAEVEVQLFRARATTTLSPPPWARLTMAEKPGRPGQLPSPVAAPPPAHGGGGADATATTARFANSILPASPDFSGITRKAMPIAQTTPIEAAASIHNLQSPRALALLESARKIVGQSTFLKAFPGNVNDTAEPALDPSLRRLTMLYYPRSKSSFSASERLSPSLFLWETLRYSVVSEEIASHDRMSNYSAQSKSCLESLRSELNSSSGFILSLLFRVSHSARVLNRREVLLRFEGTSLPMVDPESEGEISPDIQFWKQCADLVLAQDPFSSLMYAVL